MTTTQPAALPEPVGFRHSLTHTLHETEAEVQLADAESEAEPLYTADQMRAYALAALQPQPAAAVSDAEISRIWSWSATAEAERTATTQQHAFAYALLALQLQAVPMTEGERLAIAERYCTKNWTDNYLALIDAVIADVQAHHGITAQGAKGGQA